METDVNGATSFSDVDLEAPQSNYTQFLDTICPYYLMYGMSREQFWNGDLNALYEYWQAYQFDMERQNRIVWLAGMYVLDAIETAFDAKHQHKYPAEPRRITKMTEAEKEAENRRKVEQFREQLLEIKRRYDRRNKGVDGNDSRKH